jgi:hypothetical protein
VVDTTQRTRDDVWHETWQCSYSTKVEGGKARVRAEYTQLPSTALTVLNRRVRHGVAFLRVNGPGNSSREVFAFPDAKRVEFVANVPSGATSVDVLSIDDACGNSGR